MCIGMCTCIIIIFKYTHNNNVYYMQSRKKIGQQQKEFFFVPFGLNKKNFKKKKIQQNKTPVTTTFNS